jgi:hypothetical protein
MCQTVLQQRCSSAVHAVLAALLLHTMLKNAECRKYCNSAALLLRAAQHEWHMG